MADQIFNVECGFFDSVNGDRLYTANDMNRPYKRIIANGVFATPSGTPSTDLQVLSAGSGMGINVSPGDGLFAYKWFSNPSAIAITVPANSSAMPRIDSVLVQVDTRTSARVGSIVYRTGTPSSRPVAPKINTERGVVEYRLANINVAAGATVINQDAIADMRGSAECPWVTSLIRQVDTSQLFNQWQAAYARYYADSTAAFDAYTSEQEAKWEGFLETLTTELTVTTNIAMFTSSHTVLSGETVIPIDIVSYDPSSDVLMVFKNGLKATEGIDYTINAQNRPTITLIGRVTAGTVIDFTVLKSLAVTEVETVLAALQRIDSEISAMTADSGWNDIALQNGALPVSGDVPSVRKVGDRVYIRGSFTGVNTVSTSIGRLPMGFRPSAPLTYSTVAVPNMSPATMIPVVMQIGSDGSIRIYARSSAFAINSYVPITFNFVID